MATDFFLCLTQLGSCCVYFLFVATNLSEIGSHYSEKIDVRIYIVMLLVPMVLLNFLKNLKYLAPVSLIASALFMTGEIPSSLIYNCVESNENGNMGSLTLERIMKMGCDTICMENPIPMFSFSLNSSSCHPIFPVLSSPIYFGILFLLNFN